MLHLPFLIFCVDLPTMPMNVVASDVKSTSATLTWDAPSFQGIFNIRFYRVRLVPSPNSNGAIETNMTTTFVSGLFPGIEYSFTVVAVFTDPLSQEVEIESSSVLFNTSVSGL